jgi:2-polyprenyl-6-methoxyphenol hydroxylase-like FAD-dependent oxidoreductase
MSSAANADVVVVDTVIVGAGIAGLYAAHCLRQTGTDSLVILEKQPTIGGRMGTEWFHGVPVAIGAGVGRKRKDRRLMALLRELGVPHREFPHHSQSLLDGGECTTKSTFLRIRKAYKETAASLSKRPTFREFAEPLLGAAAYAHFLACSGYTDYENEDVESVLYDYGFSDNYDHWTALGIRWSTVRDRLVKSVGRRRILTEHAVVRIRQDPATHRFTVLVRDRAANVAKRYDCETLVLATTVSAVRALLPEFPIYRHICGQPFLRIYAQFDARSADRMRSAVPVTTLVEGPLQKILPMDAAKGVYMVAYSDNEHAQALHAHRTNTPRNRLYLARQVERALGMEAHALHVLDTVHFYWEEGTHYYAPLPAEYGSREEFIREAQRPMRNLFVVGEMVSKQQGWVEGALESVEKGLFHMARNPMK